MQSREARNIELRNKYLWLVFPLAFVAVIVANATLTYFAFTSWPGLAYENASERGRKFNMVLHEDDKESALGWQFAISYAGQRIEVQAHDATGQVLRDLDIKGTLLRPLGPTLDRKLEFKAVAPGLYHAAIDAPALGQWEVRILAMRDGESVHDAQRFVIR